MVPGTCSTCILQGLPLLPTSSFTSILNRFLLQPASKLAQESRVGTGVLYLYLLCYKGEEEVEQVPAETLYQGLLPSLPQYMVSAPALEVSPPLRECSGSGTPPVPISTCHGTALPATLALRGCPAGVSPSCRPPEHLPKDHFSGLRSAAPQIALLKILLAAAPTSKAKTDSINILADVLPEEMP